MRKQLIMRATAFLGMLFILFSSVPAHAALSSTLEVGEVRTIGKEVVVPITLHKTSYLTSLNTTIRLSTNAGSVTLKSFEPTGIFTSGSFSTKGNINNNELNIDILSTTGAAQRLTGNEHIIGYVTVGLSASFIEGSIADIKIETLSAKGNRGADITLDKFDGKIEHQIPYGDVLKQNKPTAAGALRVLQHIQGNQITDEAAFLAADVDADGMLTQQDALQILDFITGNQTSFLAVKAKELDSAVMGSTYSAKFEGVHGRAPYKFTRAGGSFPAGLTLNADTGEITGKPTRASAYTFTVRVTDALDRTETRQFTLDVIDSNIRSVTPVPPVNVMLNGKPALPTEVSVTYADRSTGKESVVWEAVDTSKLGKFIVKGKVGNSGFTTSVEVHVVGQEYLENITIDYMAFLNIHTITMNVSPSVYSITIDNMLVNSYDGNNQFSYVTNSLAKDATVVIRLYDRFGNLLETKQQSLAQ